MSERIGSYEIIRVIARGGMAVVYLARQPALGREVALKRLDLDRGDAVTAQRFVREARLAAGLDHQNIVTLFDFCEVDGVAYIAMEHVAGGSLRRQIGRLTLPQVVGVLEDVLAGLRHAEQHGISHRDLKPENLLVTAQGTVKIADFGIARAYESMTGRLTGTGLTLGTPAYMAPEQALDRPLGPQTDLYALGVIAYEMLAGAPPFPPADGPIAVLYRQVHEPVPALAARAPGAPPELCAWVERLLEKDPGDRPASAAAAWSALEEIAVSRLGPYWRRDARLLAAPQDAPETRSARASTRSPPATTRAAAPGRRRRQGAAVLAGVAAAGFSVPVLVAGRSSPEPPARRAPAAAAPVAAFDFDGDGRQEIAAGRPAAGRGGVLVLAHGRRAPAPIAPGGRGMAFGAAVASADFDRDGHADLAVGAPGDGRGARARREGAVTVRYGSPGGLAESRRQVLDGPAGSPVGLGAAFGASLSAGDFDGDGFEDLAVGAPGADPYPIVEGGSGVVQVVPGSRRGLAPGRARLIRRPSPRDAGFGRVLAAADVDGDGRDDLLVGAPRAADRAGHLYRCARAARCRPLGGGRDGAVALAVADVTGDGRPDVAGGLPWAGTAGAVRLWRGTAGGGLGRPVTITQEDRHVPGNDQRGDAFGAALAAGDLDGDRHADLLIGSPGEDAAAGRFTVLRGAASGYAAVGSRAHDQQVRFIPGRKRAGSRFAESVAVLDFDGDGKRDLLVGEPRAASVMWFPGTGDGFFGGDVRRIALGGPRPTAVRLGSP